MTTPIREVTIHRADGPVQPVVIRIEHEAPETPPTSDYAQQAAARFQEQGESLADALWEALPGGTIDALLGAMLTRRASLLRVRFAQEAQR